MDVRFVAVCVGGLLVACGHAPSGGVVVVRGEPTGITVVGEGEAEAAPDLAVFRIGVEARRPTVAEAREAAAGAQQAVIEALRGAGIEQRDIQTAQLSITPDYEYSEAGRRLLGYVVTNSVEVRARALDRVGPAIDAAVAAGGDLVRLEGLRFELEEADAAQAQARERAIEEARAKAAQIAAELGVTLGAPESVEEVSATAPSPVVMRLEAAEARAETPVEPGTTRVRVELRVRWGID